MPRSSLAVAVSMICLGIGVRAGAQTNASAEGSLVERQQRAHSHYERGVAASQKGRLEEAELEFQTAYDISPSFHVLYNLGLAKDRLDKVVEAVEIYARYLASGGTSIPEARRRAIHERIGELQKRVGQLVLSVRPEAAAVHLDEKTVARAELGRGMVLQIGKHSIVVRADGYRPQTREVEIAAGVTTSLAIELEPEAREPAPAKVVATPEPPAATLPPSSEIRSRYPAPVRTTPSSSNGAGQRITGYALGGLAAVITGTGVVLAIVGRNAAESADQRMSDAETATAWDRAKADFDKGKSLNRMGWITAGAGATVGAVSVLLVLSAPSRKSSATLRLRSWASSGNERGVLLEGHW